MLDSLGPAELLAALAMVFAGVLVQGTLGLGFALVSVPALLLIEPRAVPATPLLLALPLVLTMAMRERHAIDLEGFGLLTAGRVGGTLAAVALIKLVTASALAALVGAMLLMAVAASLLRPSFKLRAAHRVAAGFASGVMGTAGAVGGPALGLAYQRSAGPELRATLAVAFAVGLLMSLAALGVAGEIEGGHFRLALTLLPAVLAALWLSPRVDRRLDSRWLRPAVLGFAGVAGAGAIVQTLV